jgi:hypothetical protein
MAAVALGCLGAVVLDVGTTLERALAALVIAAAVVVVSSVIARLW